MEYMLVRSQVDSHDYHDVRQSMRFVQFLSITFMRQISCIELIIKFT